MTIKPPPTHVQGDLFTLAPQLEIPSPASARTHYGNVVEEIICQLLRLENIANSGQYDLVYDAHGHGSFVEIKSIHRTGSLPLYEWRKDKDKAFTDGGGSLVYVLGMHSTRNATSLGQVWEWMAKTLDDIYVVPAYQIHDLSMEFPLRQLVKEDSNTRMGYKRKGYCKGYRNIGMKRIRDLGFLEPFTLTAEKYGFDLVSRVHVSPDLGEFARALKGC